MIVVDKPARCTLGAVALGYHGTIVFKSTAKLTSP
jgi:hypothetical protein